MLKKSEYLFESIIFNSRWLLAPFYFGLVLGIGLLLVKFIRELIHIVPGVLYADGSEAIVGVLSLVDVTLVANLLIIVIFAGYENFVSKIDTGDHEDRPDWMGKVDFTDLKIKLFGSIVAISGIELLNAFMKAEAYSDKWLAWKVGIHLTFVVSGLLFALMDRLGHGRHQGAAGDDH